MSLKFYARQDLRGLTSRSSLKRMVSRQASLVSPLPLFIPKFHVNLTYHLAHILRLLATHHLLREVSPDVFALNRLSSLIDSGKSFAQLKQFETEGRCVYFFTVRNTRLILDERPEMKYRDTNGIAAFVGLWLVLRTSRLN